MIALQYRRPKQLVKCELPVPQIKDDEVLIKTAFAGICGTDLHIMNGASPAAAQVVPGHEFSGTVVQTGKNVTNVAVGDRVAVDPNNYCGACNPCRDGQIHFCKAIEPLGVFRDGAWAEYCAAPAKQVYPLPEAISLEWAALSEPLSCLLHGWDQLQPLRYDQSVLIPGSGLMGLLWGLTLRQFGFTRLLLSEPRENRRAIARKLKLDVLQPGIIYSNFAETNAGYDIIIDCSGSAAAIEQAIDWLNPRGKFLFFGICPQNKKINIEPFKIFQKELTLIGSVINPFTFNRAIDLTKKLQRPLEDLGVRFFKLHEYEKAISAAGSGAANKVIFEL